MCVAENQERSVDFSWNALLQDQWTQYHQTSRAMKGIRHTVFHDACARLQNLSNIKIEYSSKAILTLQIKQVTY